MSYLPANKGRILLVAGIGLMWSLLFYLFQYQGWTPTWELWGVPTEPGVFWDFRLIPGSAESFRQGFEPSVENPAVLITFGAVLKIFPIFGLGSLLGESRRQFLRLTGASLVFMLMYGLLTLESQKAALLGNNWDYRLAFLVLAVPQLSGWISGEHPRQRAVALAVMVAVVLSCWHFIFLIDIPVLPFEDQIDRIVAFDETINWLLLPGFSYLLVASLPEHFRPGVRPVTEGNADVHERRA